MNLLLAASDPISHVVSHPIFEEPVFSMNIGGPDTTIPFFNIKNGVYEFYVTNHLMMTFVTAIVVVLTFWLLSRRVRVSGTGLQAYQTKGRVSQMFELMCSFIRDEVARPNLHGLTDKYIYYIWTIFFFVLFANVIGLIPFGSIIYLFTRDPHHLHLGGTATGTLSLNSVLAIGSFIAVLYIGIRETGLKAFLSHFNPIGWDGPKLLSYGIGIPLYALEWMGLFIKCTVLAMRLFGTMMAGHLVIATFIGMIFLAAQTSSGLGYAVQLSVIVGGVILTLLELFICCLQAFIFTFLTVLFIALVAADHGHEHEEHDPFSDEDQMDLDKLISPERITPMPDPAG